MAKEAVANSISESLQSDLKKSGRQLPYGKRPTLNKERIKGSHRSTNREQTLLFETRQGVTMTRRVWYEVGAYVCNKESGGSEERRVVYVYLGIYKMWQCIAP